MARTQPLKVLVADDDEDILQLVRVALQAEKYEILIARDGEEAVTRALTQHPDLILLDVEMPLKNGLEACQALRADPHASDIPIIMLTSRGTERDIVRGFEGGAHDYITKPFSISHLRARVKTWLLRSGRASEEGEGSSQDESA